MTKIEQTNNFGTDIPLSADEKQTKDHTIHKVARITLENTKVCPSDSQASTHNSLRDRVNAKTENNNIMPDLKLLLLKIGLVGAWATTLALITLISLFLVLFLSSYPALFIVMLPTFIPVLPLPVFITAGCIELFETHIDKYNTARQASIESSNPASERQADLSVDINQQDIQPENHTPTAPTLEELTGT